LEGYSGDFFMLLNSAFTGQSKRGPQTRIWLKAAKVGLNLAEVLQSIPGIGLISARELLLELQDVSPFRRAVQLAAYVGLTPSQYSSADKVRVGRITGVGKNTPRSLLVEASWTLISKDQAMCEKYERIKIRSGGKRAIVGFW
jgi:transposase